MINFIIIFFTTEINSFNSLIFIFFQLKMVEREYDTPIHTPQNIKTYKSLSKIFSLTLTLSLSSFYIGYSFVSITHTHYYDSKQLLLIFPVGAAIGALFSYIVLKRLSRRKSLIVINFLSIIVSGLILIQNLLLFIFCRFAQGFCVGVYSVLIPIMIREFAPTEIYGTLGCLFQCFISLGTFTFYLLQQIFSGPQFGKEIIIFGFPHLTTTIQSILLFSVYKFQTPKYLLSKGLLGECQKVLKQLYKQEHLEMIYNQKYKEVYPFSEPLLNASQLDDLKFKIKFRKIRIFVALYLAIQQWLCGLYIILNFSLYLKLDSLIILIGTGSQFFGTVLAIPLFNKFGRKTIMLVGNAILSLAFLIVLLFLLLQLPIDDDGTIQILYDFCLILFITTFGLSLGPFFWIYVPEIVPSEVIPFSTFTYWAITFLIRFTSFYVNFDEKVFIFFFVWNLLSLIINKKFVIETKGKSEEHIYIEYDKIKLC